MRLQALERRLTTVLEALLAGGLLALLLLILTLVTLRYLFQTGLVGANETATALFVYLSAIGAAVAVGRGEHISVELVPNHLGERWRHRLELGALALVAAFNAVLVERSVVWIAVTGHTLMPATQLPRIAVQLSIPLGCGLAAAYCCARMARLLKEGPDP